MYITRETLDRVGEKGRRILDVSTWRGK